MFETNPLHAGLAGDGDGALGCWAVTTSPRAAEVLSTAGLDWVGIDLEHGPGTVETVDALVRGIERGPAVPLVRLPSVAWAVGGGCKRVLDAGARGLVCPRVESRAAVESLLDAARLPPDGSRGVAGTTRANGYGAGFDGYAAGANDDLAVVVQIETPAGVAAAPEILAPDGVDAVLVGRNDLSATLDGPAPGESDHPAVRAATDRVREAALDAGVAPGIKLATPDRLADRRAAGYRLFLLGSDLSLLRDAVGRATGE